MGGIRPRGRLTTIILRRVVAWSSPTPRLTTLILGTAKPPETRPEGPNFSGFLAPAVQSRGGVGGLRPLP